MDKHQIPGRLSSIQESLGFISRELVQVAESVKEDEENKDHLWDKLLGFSSIIASMADQIGDADAAARRSDEQEIGQAVGMLLYPHIKNQEETEGSHE